MNLLSEFTKPVVPLAVDGVHKNALFCDPIICPKLLIPITEELPAAGFPRNATIFPEVVLAEFGDHKKACVRLFCDDVPTTCPLSLIL